MAAKKSDLCQFRSARVVTLVAYHVQSLIKPWKFQASYLRGSVSVDLVEESLQVRVPCPFMKSGTGRWNC